MYIEAATPKFVSIERYNDYGKIAKVIVRVNNIDYVEATLGKVYFLDKTVVTQVTRDSMKALEEALVGTTDKEADKTADKETDTLPIYFS